MEKLLPTKEGYMPVQKQQLLLYLLEQIENPDKVFTFKKAKVYFFWKNAKIKSMNLKVTWLLNYFNYLNIMVEYHNGDRYLMPIEKVYDNDGEYSGERMIQDGKIYNASALVDIDDWDGELVGFHWECLRTHFNMDDFTIREQIETR